MTTDRQEASVRAADPSLDRRGVAAGIVLIASSGASQVWMSPNRSPARCGPRHNGPMDGASIRVREGQPDDDTTCLGVIRRSFATVADEFGFRPDTHQIFPAYWTPDRFATARAHDGLLLVAEYGDEIVGCCFAGADRNDASSWQLKRLAVIPEARHHGVGARLVSAAASRASTAGMRRLSLRIVASNQHLANWYLTLGFLLVATSRPAGLPFEVADFELPVP